MMAFAKVAAIILFSQLFQGIDRVGAFCFHNNNNYNLQNSNPTAFSQRKHRPATKLNVERRIADYLLPSNEQKNDFISSELLNGLSHVALDFTTMFGRNAAVLKSVLVLGHISAIASDYLPNHHLSPYEAILQVVALCIASGSLAKTLAPVFMSNIVQKEDPSLSYQHRKTFSSLFSPVGVTWSQFQALTSDSLDWLNVEPGEKITSLSAEECEHDMHSEKTADYAYWVLSGTVKVQNDKDNSKAAGHHFGKGLIGDAKTIWNIENYLQAKSSISSTSSSAETNELTNVTLGAGEEGATLLRIDLRRLKEEVQYDNKLAQSIRLLLMKGILDKEGALMEAYQAASL